MSKYSRKQSRLPHSVEKLVCLTVGHDWTTYIFNEHVEGTGWVELPVGLVCDRCGLTEL